MENFIKLAYFLLDFARVAENTEMRIKPYWIEQEFLLGDGHLPTTD